MKKPVRALTKVHHRLAMLSILLCSLAYGDPATAIEVSGHAPEHGPCAWQGGEAGKVTVSNTTLAGVPAILRAPPRVTMPLIVLWHGFGPPASEADLMKALPLDEVPAVKVYLGLPLFGARSPSDGSDSLAQRQAKDYASLLFEPVVMGAAKELRAVLEALRTQKCLDPNDKIGLFGFSAGGAAVLFALAERDVPVRAAVVVNAPTGLNASIEALERATKRPYVWTPATRQLAERSDFVRRAGEIAAGDPPPALLIFQGADDPVVSSQGAGSLAQALRPQYQRSGTEPRLKLLVAPGVGHDWTVPPAVQQLGAAVSDWFNRHSASTP